MRRILPDPRFARARGFSLVELVIAMVLVGIVVGATLYFISPLRQAVDVTTRAELTDAADNALQRIGREVRLALPNSVRIDGDDGVFYLEFLPVRAAGRYRSDGGGASGTNCPDTADAVGAAANRLSFGFEDSCFKSIGAVTNGADIDADDDFLVLNNYGPGFTGQNAYENLGAGANRVQLTAIAADAPRLRISFNARTFQRALHDSPGRRFFVVSEPVTYECNPGTRTLTRHDGYAIDADQPMPPDGTARVIANDVTGCVAEYAANAVAQQVGLLTLRITLSRALSGGATETVSLYHAVHVNNVP